MQDFEKLASFYLGRAVDPDSGAVGTEPLLYDAKDLTTHALIVGMTGSGKTGLGVGLLEEAALDGVPAIAIDPKGDLGNLMLTFPRLAPSDFAPWIDPAEAVRAGQEPAEYARTVAERWRAGLADWGQDGARIARLRAAADVAVYTPGSRAGLPLSVLRSFDAPAPAVAADGEALSDRLQSAVGGLCALIGADPDPIQSREFVLLSNLVSHAWRAGRGVGLEELIAGIQRPPFDVLGVLDLEAFFPAKERFGLAMRLNNLLASPGFADWLEGEPLDVGRLLTTPEGRPRVAVVSIAHLSDEERMFVVTLVLNEVLAWARAQPGTSSLRAILYMDEIFGYFPPTAAPPSKRPMLTLLKQARAHGLGVVLSTQNPVDLDYKGLSNAGTWFLGRLQTERDKARVLDGLESARAGGGFDRSAADGLLSGLGKRTFLMHCVHEDAPALFRTRWALSYLRGPLTRDEIRRLMADRVAARDAAVTGEARARAASTRAAEEAAGAAAAGAGTERPVPADGVRERFVAGRERADGEARLMRPALHFPARLHHASRTAGVDRWSGLQVVAPLAPDDDPVAWEEAWIGESDEPPASRRAAPADARWAELPPAASKKRSWTSWRSALKRWLYEHRALELQQAKALKLVSEPGERPEDFRGRLRTAAAERRDLELEKLRKKYESRLVRAREKVRKAEEKVGREEEQVSQKRRDSVIQTGVTLIGALFGRRTLSRAGSSLKSAGRVSKEKADVARAERALEAARADFERIERDLEEALAAMEDRWHPSRIAVTEIVVRPRKSDLSVGDATLLWLPWRVGADGVAVADHELAPEPVSAPRAD